MTIISLLTIAEIPRTSCSIEKIGRATTPPAATSRDASVGLPDNENGHFSRYFIVNKPDPQSAVHHRHAERK